MQRLKYLVFVSGLACLAVFQSATAANMRVFHADMTADNETKFTESPATGKADITLDLDAKQIKWVVSFSGLKSEPVSIAIYGPAQPGANGQMMFSLAPKGLKSPLTGTSPVTEGQIQYLLYGWTYVNVITKDFEKGEIRGQLDIKQAAQK